MQANLLHQTLVRVKKLISKPENWTKYSRARDRYGVCCLASGTDAVSFCLIGAIERVVAKEESDNLIYEFTEFWNKKFNTYPVDYNDSHSHSEVIAKLDEFIALAKEGINQ